MVMPLELATLARDEVELEAIWRDRDRRYGSSVATIGERGVDAVRSWRAGEAFEIRSDRLMLVASRWTAPPHLVR